MQTGICNQLGSCILVYVLSLHTNSNKYTFADAYSSLPQYTGVLTVYHSILGYSSLPQYFGLLKYTGVLQYTCTRVPRYSNSGVLQYTRVLQFLPGTPINYVWCTHSLSLSNLLLSKVSVELYFEHRYDLTPAFFLQEKLRGQCTSCWTPFVSACARMTHQLQMRGWCSVTILL